MTPSTEVRGGDVVGVGLLEGLLEQAVANRVVGLLEELATVMVRGGQAAEPVVGVVDRRRLDLGHGRRRGGEGRRGRLGGGGCGRKGPGACGCV